MKKLGDDEGEESSTRERPSSLIRSVMQVECCALILSPSFLVPRKSTFTKRRGQASVKNIAEDVWLSLQFLKERIVAHRKRVGRCYSRRALFRWGCSGFEGLHRPLAGILVLAWLPATAI